MPTCPKCKAKIDRLSCMATETSRQWAYASQNHVEYDWAEGYEFRPEFFRCPECEGLLFDNELNVLEFLKGE